VPSVWNSLEPDLRFAPSLVSFKSRLKAALSLPPIVGLYSAVHCQAAPPIRTRPWTLCKFVLYCNRCRYRPLSYFVW